MTMTLSKTLDTADYDTIEAVDHLLTRWVDPYFGSASPQQEQRRWEYGMACLAARIWEDETQIAAVSVLDVGGAGSPFHTMIAKSCFAAPPVVVVDPAAPEPHLCIEKFTITPAADMVFALSVLEHVKDENAFLEACVRNLLPGGLLFLTVDFAQEPYEVGKRTLDGRGYIPDTAHFHWMRDHIYDAASLMGVGLKLEALGCRVFGGASDYRWRGAQLYGSYTFASLCVRKDPDAD